MTPVNDILATLDKITACLARDPKRAERLICDVRRMVGELTVRLAQAPAKGADVVLPSEDEAAVHMYPSDLKRFEFGEHTGTAFSIAVGCPDERSQPLFTLEQVRAAVLADRQQRGGDVGEQLKLRIADALTNMRSNNYAEAQYWLDQWTQIGRAALSATKGESNG